MTPGASLVHLARRFFFVWRAAGLAPYEQLEAAAVLMPAERRLFWEQSVPDQRHGLECSRRVAAQRPDDREAQRAALLHDVGKRHAGLGVIGRAVATIAGRLRIPGPAAWRSYRDHGERGAGDLIAAGSGGLVVEYARRHPGPPPAGFDPARWQTLLDADDD